MVRTMTALMLMLVMLPVAAIAAEETVTVRDAYVRGLPPGVKNTAAYMTIINNGDEDLELIGANTNAADNTMLHTTVNRNGQLSMEHVMSRTVPAGGELVLESGGLHLMLMGLRKPLASGDIVSLTLQFKGAFVVPLELPVVSVLDE
jgi:copper(I)-binding protein